MKKSVAPTKNHVIVGLQPLDRMPIEFENRIYDLANLTNDQATYLLGFPEQVPFIKPADAAALTE